MTDVELIEIVKQMRTAQTRYFRERQTFDLETSKRLERVVDAELKRREDAQPELF